MYQRHIQLPTPGTETFFLWGPRQTGKSTLLKQLYRDALWVDLLKADVFRTFVQNPERLREQLAIYSTKPAVVIDEIQKVPALLDEVHWLHENEGVRFALCGSSARKVKRGYANLLGGRALRYELRGMVWPEIKSDWNLERVLNHGYLPRFYEKATSKRAMAAYVGDYLKEEITAEGLVQNLPVFADFLNIAALHDTETINFSNIARDIGISSPSVKNYIQILQDTLIVQLLPAYSLRPKRRPVKSPKLYFFDAGVVNFLTSRFQLSPGNSLFGKALENYLYHEIATYNNYAERFESLHYWGLSTGVEVDFIVGHMKVAVEVKSSRRINDSHLKGLRELRKDHPECKRSIVVCLESVARKTHDNIEIYPVADFLSHLWSGTFF